jgi:hypothetical protein
MLDRISCLGAVVCSCVRDTNDGLLPCTMNEKYYFGATVLSKVPTRLPFVFPASYFFQPHINLLPVAACNAGVATNRTNPSS